MEIGHLGKDCPNRLTKTKYSRPEDDQPVPKRRRTSDTERENHDQQKFERRQERRKPSGGGIEDLDITVKRSPEPRRIGSHIGGATYGSASTAGPTNGSEKGFYDGTESLLSSASSSDRLKPIDYNTKYGLDFLKQPWTGDWKLPMKREFQRNYDVVDVQRMVERKTNLKIFDGSQRNYHSWKHMFIRNFHVQDTAVIFKLAALGATIDQDFQNTFFGSMGAHEASHYYGRIRRLEEKF